MWFPGVHCDVGGGYRDTSLSDIPCCGWPHGRGNTACNLCLERSVLTVLQE